MTIKKETVVHDPPPTPARARAQDDDASERVAIRLSQELGERLDRTQRLVDQYGPELSMAALAWLREQQAGGWRPRTPLAAMFSKLRSGELQAKAALDREGKTSAGDAEWLRSRYCEGKQQRARDGIEDTLVCWGCGKPHKVVGETTP